MPKLAQKSIIVVVPVQGKFGFYSQLKQQEQANYKINSSSRSYFYIKIILFSHFRISRLRDQINFFHFLNGGFLLNTNGRGSLTLTQMRYCPSRGLTVERFEKLFEHSGSDDVIVHALTTIGHSRKLDGLNRISRRVDSRQDRISLPIQVSLDGPIRSQENH